MIFYLLALAAATPHAAMSDEALYRDCVAVVKQDPNRAVTIAGDWRMSGGGVYARQCLGLAYTKLERWEPAATAFEQAAREAERAQDPRRADFWVQSGNSWLAAGDGVKARAAFDAALATTSLAPELRGEVHLDRARADVLLKDDAAARVDLDRGLQLVPADPFGWYLSAALALRQEQVPRAQTDIAKAVQLAPDDADVLLLAGNVAGTAGDVEAARNFYSKAILAAPDSPTAKAAQAALVANSADAPTAAAPMTKE